MNDANQPRTITGGPEFLATGLVHTVLEPAAPGPYPTVVMLQGRKGNEQVMWIFRRTIPRNWLMVAPRAIVEDEGGYSWMLQAHGRWPETADFDDASAAITRFVTALPGLYNADPERTYLMGFSQGAAAALCAQISQPGLARGIASLVGFAPQDGEESAGDAFLRLPVHMAVGLEDDRIPLPISHQTRDFLQEAGANLEYHEYDTGHKLNSAGMRDLQDWWARR